MKLYHTIAILLLFSGISVAQDSSVSLRFGSGYYLWGSGDLRVPTAELEIRKDFNRYLGIGLAVDAGHYSSLFNEVVIDGPRNVLTTFGAHQLLNFTFLRSKIINLSIVAGTSVRYYNQLKLTPPYFLDSFYDEEGTFRSERYIVFGGQFRPEVMLNLTSKDQINLAILTTKYTRSEIFSGISVSYVRKL